MPNQNKKPLLWVFDLETTGLPHEADKVVPVQIAGVMIDPNQEGWPQVGEFQTFLSLPADAHRSEYAMAMHAKKGRDEAFFAEAGMPPALAYTKLAEWLSGFGSKAVPVAHNAPFDVPLLKRDAFRHGINLDDHMDYHSLDTAAMAFERYVLTGQLEKCGLKNLAPFLGVEFDEKAAHDAMYDVKATAECLRRMMGAYAPETVIEGEVDVDLGTYYLAQADRSDALSDALKQIGLDKKVRVTIRPLQQGE